MNPFFAITVSLSTIPVKEEPFHVWINQSYMYINCKVKFVSLFLPFVDGPSAWEVASGYVKRVLGYFAYLPFVWESQNIDCIFG